MVLHNHALGYAWAFVASFANASTDNLRKFASSRVHNPSEIVALSELVNVVALTAAIVITGKWSVMMSSMRHYDFMALAGAAGVLKALSGTLLQRALQLTPLSLCVPYLAFTPLWLLVISFFLVHETPTVRGVCGVCVITLGAYLLNANAGKDGEKFDKSPRASSATGDGAAATTTTRTHAGGARILDAMSPAGAKRTLERSQSWMSIASSGLETVIDFGSMSLDKRAKQGLFARAIGNQIDTLRNNPGSLLTMLCAALYALIADLDKLGKLHSSDLLVFMCVQRCFICFPTLALVLVRSPSAFKNFKSSRTAVTLVLIGLTDIAGMAAFLNAINYIFTSYAVAAKRTSILASVVGGAVFFKEPIARRLPYIFIMFIGMALVLLADADRH